MKLLVTGGLGFIGSNFIRYIMSANPGYSIINVDKMGIGSNQENLRDLEDRQSYQFVKGDITEYPLKEILEKVDAIINFAAETHVDRSISDPLPFIQSNIIGTFNLLEAERKLNRSVRHVQISTDETYGDILEGAFNEEDRIKPSNPYSASKAAADMLCQSYHRTYGLDVVITRSTNNFGPYQFPEKLIPKTIIRAKKGLSIPIYGTGENKRDWMYVVDNCEAVDLVLKKGKSGEIYNIAPGNESSNIEIVEKILKMVDRSKDLIRHVEDRPGHDIRYGVDSSKIREDLGWKPKNDMESSLKKTVKWYLENEWWWKPLLTEDVLKETPWKSS